MNIQTPEARPRRVRPGAVVSPVRVVMFQPRFAELVVSGKKCQTVRPPRKRPIQIGDRLSLRAWTGAPYRSKHCVLREAVVTRVTEVCIRDYGMSVGGGPMLTPQEQHAFAVADGFSGEDEMRSWFAGTHGLPFDGVMIWWANPVVMPAPPSSPEPAAGPCAIVIFGASGDLTKRLLVPALLNLQTFGLLPGNFAVVGVGRHEGDDASLRAKLGAAVRELGTQKVDDAIWKQFEAGLFYCAGDFDDPGTFTRLRDRLAELERERGTGGNVLFYLATPSGAFTPIVTALAGAGLLKEEDNRWRRVILEKPFGRDLASAQLLNRQLGALLREDQIYRIDHYFGKETVQNLLVFRFGNAFLEPTWNRNHVDHVQITVGETLGVEGRGSFYETAGALRDVLENHVVMLLALVCMEPPNALHGDALRNEMVKVLDAIHPFANPEEVFANTARGQYGEGEAGGKHLVAYRASEKVAPGSPVETFAAVRLRVDNWRWAGVPFYLRTGKALAEAATRIVVEFKCAPLMLFACGEGPVPPGPNRLIFDVQPRQGITFHFRGKTPGAGMHTRQVAMNFDYGEFGDAPRATGYETLLYDAMLGDNTLFHRADLVEAAWKVATPILDTWAARPPTDFPNYAPGSPGPACADELLARDGHRWWTPDSE